MNRVFAVVAAALASSMFLKAMCDVSTTWDVWYYHLPFAARMFDIVPREAFEFHALNEARYRGFPLLGELLQGLLWVAFGRPEAANLVALGSVAVYVLFLKRVFDVPTPLSILALLAIPLVQAHATSCYVDLPANVAASILVMSAYEAFLLEGALPGRLLARIAVAAAVAANIRLQLNPLVAVILAAVGVRAIAPHLRSRTRAGARRAFRTAAVALVVLPIVFASPMKNVACHGNPVYPMKMTVLGVTLPGPEEVYSDAPPYLARSPRPVRFAFSLLEVGIREMGDPGRWSVDQWMPPASTGNRMGGFFGAYVVLNFGLFAWRTLRDPSRSTRTAAVVFLGLTLFAAFLPQSHELRYYMFWMIVLVSMNLVAVARPDARALPVGRVAFGAGCLVAVAVVAVVTKGVFVLPSGFGFDALLREKVSPAAIADIRHGERVCLVKEPWTMLYASPFHAPLTYRVREAEALDQCAGDRLVP